MIMRVKKKITVLVIGLLVLVLFAVYVYSAATLEQFLINAPTNNSRFSGNVIINLTAGASLVDANLEGFTNITVNITNSSNSVVIGQLFSNNLSNHTVTWNSANGSFPDGNGTYGINITAFNASDSDSDDNATLTNVSRVLNISIDNTPPINLTCLNLTNGTNVSGAGVANITINATALDAMIGMNRTTTAGANGTLRINITNGTGDYVATLILNAYAGGSGFGLGGFSGPWNISNGSFPDGHYNLTLRAQDRVGNLNTTVCRNITIDRFAPLVQNVAATGTEDSVTIIWDTNEVANSSINYGTDTDLGTVVNLTRRGNVFAHIVTTGGLTSGTTYFYNITSCSGAVGNCNTTGPNNFSTRSSLGSQGSGGSSATTTTTAVSTSRSDATLNTVAESKEFAIDKDAVLTLTALPAGGGDHTVTVDSIDLAAKKVTITIASTPQTVTLSEGEIKKFDLNGNSYYDTQVTVVKVEAAKVTLDVKVLDDKEAMLGTAAAQPVEETQPAETAPAEGQPAAEVAAPPAEQPGVEEGAPLSVGMIVGLIVALVVIVGLVFFLATRKSK